MPKTSKKAGAFISKEVKHLIKDKGYTQKRAIAAAYSVARKKKYKAPKKKK